MTAEDFQYIRKVGFNTVRLPFNYKLFIDELNPGTYRQEGFDLLSFAIIQCKLVRVSWMNLEQPVFGVRPACCTRRTDRSKHRR